MTDFCTMESETILKDRNKNVAKSRLLNARKCAGEVGRVGLRRLRDRLSTIPAEDPDAWHAAPPGTTGISPNLSRNLPLIKCPSKTKHTTTRPNTMLTDKIRHSGPETNEPEDYLSSSLGVIFPDDITNQHGDRESSVIYLSPSHGSLELTLADPEGEDSRKLFSHFLWNAGVQLAEFIEEGDGLGRNWSVKGERVLELGAGTGLAGIVAGLEGAREVVVSDYPAVEVLDNIRANVKRNIDQRKEKSPGTVADVQVEGHEWGVLDDGFSVENEGGFGRLLVADCLWMPWQHESLLKSIAWFLKGTEGRAWVVAGFHTGREKMRGFYDGNAVEKAGLEVESLYERNAEGHEREWVVDRGIEDVTERKRWLVVGILKKRGG